MMHGVLRSRLIEEEAAKQKIMPFLWFDNQAEQAARSYSSEAMLKMIKFDIRTLQEAYAGEST